MLKLRVLFTVLFFSASAFGQSPRFDFVKSISVDSLRSYLYVLTSDSLEGRETGTIGQKRAANFLASKYESWGIPVQLQKHPLSARANTGKNITINDNNYVYYRDFYYVAPKSDTFISCDTILLAGFGIKAKKYDDFKTKGLQRNSFLVSWSEPNFKKKFRSEDDKPKQANSLYDFLSEILKEKPITAFVVVDSIPLLIEQIEQSKEINSLLNKTESHVVFVNRNIAERFLPHEKKKLYQKYLSKIEKRSKPNPVLKSISCTIKMVSNTKSMIGENVIAYIEGKSKKEECIVVSSHYDHLGIRDSSIYRGADDNGSGTSAVLEMARVFQIAKNAGQGPERSIIFLNVSGEEKGLLGSMFYVKHPFIPLDKTVADLNIDMIGRVDDKHDSLKVQDYVYLIGADRLSKELSTINEKSNSDFTHLELDLQFDNDKDPNNYYKRSDHYNFAKNNVPVIFYFNGSHADYHRPSDTPDKINFELIKKRGQLVFLTAWELVNRNERIRLNKQ